MLAYARAAVTRTRLLFPLILLIAVAVRLWGIGFGLPYVIARPDETAMAGPAVGFLSGDLRPPYFEWPTLFTYATAFLYVIYFYLSRPFTGHATLAAFAESRRQSVAPFLYITRSLSALMGVLTVWWVYAICRRLFDETPLLANRCSSQIDPVGSRVQLDDTRPGGRFDQLRKLVPL